MRKRYVLHAFMRTVAKTGTEGRSAIYMRKEGKSMTQNTNQTQNKVVVPIPIETLERYIKMDEKLAILRRVVQTEAQNDMPMISCKDILTIIG